MTQLSPQSGEITWEMVAVAEQPTAPYIKRQRAEDLAWEAAMMATESVLRGEQPESPIYSDPGAMRGEDSPLISRNGVEA